MHATLPLIEVTDFPAIRRRRLTTLQVNLGYKCNQSCVHCHVNAGPNRTEMMSRDTVFEVIAFLKAAGAETLDVTGGAPELNPHFRMLITAARELGVRVPGSAPPSAGNSAMRSGGAGETLAIVQAVG